MGQDLNAWLQSVAYPQLGEIQSDAGFKAWLEQVFRAEGAVDGDRLLELTFQRRIDLTEQAIALLRRDVSVDLDPTPSLALEFEPYRLLVSCDAMTSPHQSSGIVSITPGEVTLEVADAVQDVMALERYVLWPLCPEHGKTLGPALKNGVPMWCCPTGEHGVSVIGGLAG